MRAGHAVAAYNKANKGKLKNQPSQVASQLPIQVASQLPSQVASQLPSQLPSQVLSHSIVSNEMLLLGLGSVVVVYFMYKQYSGEKYPIAKTVAVEVAKPVNPFRTVF